LVPEKHLEGILVLHVTNGSVISCVVHVILVLSHEVTVGLIESAEGHTVALVFVVIVLVNSVGLKKVDVSDFCGWVVIEGKNVILIDSGVLARFRDGEALARVNCNERDNEEASNDDEHLEGALVVVSGGPVSVLPNDVGGLGGFDEEEVVVHEFLDGVLALAGEIELGFVLFGDDLAIFGLEGDEGIYGADQLVKLLSLEL
jgi:hypothetical protein